MKLLMFSIYDKVAAIFNRPYVGVNIATGVRAFEQSLKDNPSPEDYDLYIIAEYDDQNGEMDPQTVERIRSGLDVKAGLATELIETFKSEVNLKGSKGDKK